jgi:hypothetical protein
MPRWMAARWNEVLDGELDAPADFSDTHPIFFHPPPVYARDLNPRGLTLAPHPAGLVIKAVWGWAEEAGLLGAGWVIAWVGGTTIPDRFGMVLALSARGEGSCTIRVAYDLVDDWTRYPAFRDVLI